LVVVDERLYRRNPAPDIPFWDYRTLFSILGRGLNRAYVHERVAVLAAHEADGDRGSTHSEEIFYLLV